MGLMDLIRGWSSCGDARSCFVTNADTSEPSASASPTETLTTLFTKTPGSALTPAAVAEAVERGDCERVAACVAGAEDDPMLAVAALEGCFAVAPERDSPEDQLRRQQLGDAGACEAIPHMMYVHLDKHDVQEGGCRAIWNLARDSVNAARMAEAGACKVVPAAMRAHPFSRRLQENALLALINLSRTPRSVAQIVNAGAPARVATCMKNHEKEPVIQQWACQTILNLGACSDPAVRLFGEVGGCEAVMTAMRNYPNEQSLQLMGLRAMRHLAKSKANRERLQAAGLQLIQEADKLHSSVEGVVEAAKEAREALEDVEVTPEKIETKATPKHSPSAAPLATVTAVTPAVLEDTTVGADSR